MLLLGVCLATLVNLPAVRTPFFGDDHAVLQTLEGARPGSLAARNRLDLYNFFSSDPVAIRQRMAVGLLPWRTETDQRVAHFRPLTSALLWFDHAVFDASPLGPHIHNLLWLALFVCSVGLLYRRVLPGPSAPVALFLFAINPFAVMTVAWWCCRSLPVSGTFGMLGILLHLRWREEQWPPGLPFSLVLISLALSAGEAGMQIVAFVFAYTILGDPAPARTRLSAIAPLTLLVISYLILRSGLGFGVWHNAYYVDPLRESREYLGSAVTHAPDIFVQLLTTVSNKHWRAFVGFGGTLPALAVAAGLLVVGRTLCHVLSQDQRRNLGWLLIGSGISLLPCFGSLNFVRPWTLLIPAVGFTAAIAVVLVHIWDIVRQRCATPNGTRAVYSLIGILIVLTWVLAPVLQSLLFTNAFVRPRIYDSLNYDAMASFDPAAEAVIVVRSPSAGYASTRAILGNHRGTGKRVRAVWTLSDGPKMPVPIDVQRIAPQAVTLTVTAGSLIPENDFFRSRRRPLKPGEEIDLGAFKITILDTKDAAVRRAEYRFDRPLDDPSLAVVYFDGRRMRPLPLPEVGGSVELPAGL